MLLIDGLVAFQTTGRATPALLMLAGWVLRPFKDAFDDRRLRLRHAQ
ncbi:MAG: hypothetical protein PW843_27015 [Azospirillaceae bacterium]|nr:hypothetical protein [Azospirillaceae bacterium]